MRRLLAAGAAAVLLSFAIPAGLAWAHAKVKSVSPGKNSTVHHSVREVRVTFDESVITGLIVIKTASGHVILLKRTGLKATNHAILQAIPKRALGPGRYTADWRARADDGHREKGSWSFRVR
jgi:methionine-rich copper-binding protein CopC